MKQPWIVSVPIERATVLRSLRLEPDLTVLADASQFWLRGADWSEPIAQRILALPAIQIYYLSTGEELIPFGRSVPVAKVPQGNWQPIRSWFAVELPVAAFPAEHPEQVPLQLVRGDQIRIANVIQLSLGAWSSYAEEAPLVRLNCWRFAANSQGSVLVCGEPLPPLPGMLFCEEQGIAIEAGFTLQPNVNFAVVRSMLGLRDRDVALFRSGGEMEIVRSMDFVRATRSAVRSTRLAHAST